MDDPAITIKNDSKHSTRKAFGSLAQRVLFMNIALLGLPLLIHTIFLYHREYKDSVEDAFITMRSLAESRVLYLEQMIQNQMAILHMLSNGTPLQPQEREKFLKQEEKEYLLDQILFVPTQSNDFHCDDPICRAQDFQVRVKNAIRHRSAVWLSQEDGYRIIVAKWDSRADGLFLISTKLERLITRLADQEYSPYPIRVSMLDTSGHVFFSSGTPIARIQPTEALSWIAETDNGSFLAVKIPIEGTNYHLMLDVAEENIAHLQMKDYIFRIATFIFFVCIVSGAVLIYLTRRLARPLQSLCDVMQRTASGAWHVRFIPDRLGFEINLLGSQMNRMLDAMIFHQNEAERERIVRERLAQEMRIGHQIQESMLPKDLPDVLSLEIAPGYFAAREVSGDCYDLMLLKDGRLLIAMADAADKGVSACLFSLSFRSMLRMAALAVPDLAAMVEMTNMLLMRDTANASVFITAWIGIYDPRTRWLTYCNQGHPPAFLFQRGCWKELPSTGMALGIEPVFPVTQTVLLQENDGLFLYTDGLFESMDAEHHLYGRKRLRQFLANNPAKPPRELVDSLIADIRAFTGGAPQADDLTLLAIRVRSTILLTRLRQM
jgi:serine phosphatase RsbU (regulator of sigma subunit)